MDPNEQDRLIDKGWTMIECQGYFLWVDPRDGFACSRELATWALAQQARFIYASSAATYGDGAAGMDDRDDNLASLQPLNHYGWSKHEFDQYAQRGGLLHRVGVAIEGGVVDKLVLV